MLNPLPGQNALPLTLPQIKKRAENSNKPFWQHGTKTPQRAKVISFKQLKTILLADINNIYFQVGSLLVKQTQGIPMGSPCSPALAIALCLKCEHHFLLANPSMPIKGFRFMDDLLVFGTSKSVLDSLHDLYPSPLEIEEEIVLPNQPFRFLHTHTRIDPAGTAHISFYPKNDIRQMEGKPPLKTVVPFDSHIPSTRHRARVIGALHMVVAHTNTNQFCLQGQQYFCRQFSTLGCSQTMWKNCFKTVLATVAARKSH